MPLAGFQVPRIGRSWLVMATILAAIGWVRGINIVLLLAYLLLMLWALNFLLAGRGLGRLRVKRRIEGPIFAQTPFQIAVEVANPRRRDQIGVELADRGTGPQTTGFFLVQLRASETTTFTRELTLPRRGRFRWQALGASSGYPFGLVRRSVKLLPPEDILVLPRLGNLHRGRLRRFLLCEAPFVGGLRTFPRPVAAQAEFHGLRPFRSGDSFRCIHWRTSARRGELMVREYESTTADNLVLVFDPWKPVQHLDSSVILEDLVSLAATIAWEWCRQRGDRFVLAAGGRQPVLLDGTTGPEHAQRMLETLAVVEGSASEEIGPLVDALAYANLPPGPLLLVSLRARELMNPLSARLHRAVAGLDAAVLETQDFYERPSPHAA